MPRLRPKRSEPEPKRDDLEAAICVEEFRTGSIGVLIPRWQQRALDDPIVRAHPGFFRGLVRLDEWVNDDK